MLLVYKINLFAFIQSNRSAKLIAGIIIALIIAFMFIKNVDQSTSGKTKSHAVTLTPGSLSKNLLQVSTYFLQAISANN